MDIFVPKYNLDFTGASELYRNDGDGTFTNVTSGSGMPGQPDMGHNTGDIDGDGYPDIYIGTGHPNTPFDDVLLLITPDGGGGFLANDVSVSSGITSGGPTRCHGIVLGDYDQDGFIDVYANNGGKNPGTMEENFLWQNQGNENQWVGLRLTGVQSNRSAIGARSVALSSFGREIHRYRRAGNGFANTDSPIQHFGLRPGETVENIEITWPSGACQTVWNPPMNQITDVIEVALPGDLDLDGTVGLSDIGPFVGVVLGLDADRYRVAASDVNGSGTADGADTQPFVEALVSP